MIFLKEKSWFEILILGMQLSYNNCGQNQNLVICMDIMRYLIGFLTIAVILAGGFLFLFKSNTSEINANDLPTVPEARVLSVATSSFVIIKKSNEDIENQKPLANLPSEIKAVYMTSWSASSEKK